MFSHELSQAAASRQQRQAAGWRLGVERVALDSELQKPDTQVPMQNVVAVNIHVSRAEGRRASSVTPGTDEIVNVPHFRIFLELAKKASVELNSSNHGGLTTTLSVNYRRYPFSKTDTFIDVTTIPIAAPFTVDEALRFLIVEHHVERFRLDANTGSGCVHWCETVVEHLTSRGWLAEGSSGRVGELVFAVRNAKTLVARDLENPDPPVRGTFY